MTNHTLQKSMFQTGCAFAGVAVMLGAFGAHGLKSALSETDLNTFEVGVRYHFIHAIAIIVMALSLRKLNEKIARRCLNLFIIGIVVFSVSLYLLSMRSVLGFGDRLLWIGAITPIGGLSFISAWIYLAMSGFKNTETLDSTEEHTNEKRRKRHSNPAA